MHYPPRDTSSCHSLIPSACAGAPSYNCTPLIADTHYGVRFNYDTCKALLVSEVPLRTHILFFLLTATTPTD